MRIVAGLYKGKKLFSPQSDAVRPTSDRARESIFNILFSIMKNSWAEISFADIFAGTGAMGLEALSRGAKKVVFVDMDTVSLNKNLSLFPNEKNKISVKKNDATKLYNINEKFDIIFMDAPYNKGLSEKTVNAILNNEWLAKDGLLIVETQAEETFAIDERLNLIDKRKYGIATFYFLQQK